MARPSRVLVVGSGKMAKPALDYFESVGIHTVVASNLPKELAELVSGLAYSRAVVCDCTSETDLLVSLASEADLVVSLVPPFLHPTVLKACIAAKRNMITASYISPALKELEAQAVAAGVSVMNEVGLDPGLDHITAVKMIKELKDSGAEIQEFVSSCGALPARDSIDNPLLYKLTWQPSGALKTCLRPTKYIEAGQVIEVPGSELIYRTVEDYSIDIPAEMQTWTNGDCTGYIELFGLQGIKTFKRCTFRYKGTVEMLRALIELGVYDDAAVQLEPNLTWAELVAQLAGSKPIPCPLPSEFPNHLAELATFIAGKLQGRTEAQHTKIIEGFWKLGLLSDQPIGPANSLYEAFVSLMQTKLAFLPTDHDLVVMEHKFVISRQGRKSEIRSTLIAEGGGEHPTAVSKLVGLPLACAAEWMLNHSLPPGLSTPIHPDFYLPVLAKLETLGVSFVESERPLD